MVHSTFEVAKHLMQNGITDVFTTRDIHEQMQGRLSRSQISPAISRLAQAGAIISAGTTIGKAGKKMIQYKIADDFSMDSVRDKLTVLNRNKQRKQSDRSGATNQQIEQPDLTPAQIVDKIVDLLAELTYKPDISKVPTEVLLSELSTRVYK